MFKLIKFVVFLLVLTVSCKKEEKIEPVKQPFITGRVVDAATQKGIPNIMIIIQNFWSDGWNYSIYMLASAQTNDQGEFRIDYYSKTNLDTRTLKFKQLPDGYQLAARINGQDEACIFFDPNDLSELIYGYEIEDEDGYKIELMPRNFAYIMKPEIPVGWEGDTMQLTTHYWHNPFVTDPFELNCHTQSHTEIIPLNDVQAWYKLSHPYSLIMGDHLEVGYRVYHGSVTRLSKNLTYSCPFKDTTAIVLPIQ